MNNIKNDLVMQDLVNPLPFGKRSNISPIQSKKNQMEIVHLFEEVTKIPQVKTMEKEIIHKRDITVGNNGPTNAM